MKRGVFLLVLISLMIISQSMAIEFPLTKVNKWVEDYSATNFCDSNNCYYIENNINLCDNYPCSKGIWEETKNNEYYYKVRIASEIEHLIYPGLGLYSEQNKYFPIKIISGDNILDTKPMCVFETHKYSLTFYEEDTSGPNLCNSIDFFCHKGEKIQKGNYYGNPQTRVCIQKCPYHDEYTWVSVETSPGIYSCKQNFDENGCLLQGAYLEKKCNQHLDSGISDNGEGKRGYSYIGSHTGGFSGGDRVDGTPGDQQKATLQPHPSNWVKKNNQCFYTQIFKEFANQYNSEEECLAGKKEIEETKPPEPVIQPTNQQVACYGYKRSDNCQTKWAVVDGNCAEYYPTVNGCLGEEEVKSENTITIYNVNANCAATELDLEHYQQYATHQPLSLQDCQNILAEREAKAEELANRKKHECITYIARQKSEVSVLIQAGIKQSIAYDMGSNVCTRNIAEVDIEISCSNLQSTERFLKLSECIKHFGVEPTPIKCGFYTYSEGQNENAAARDEKGYCELNQFEYSIDTQCSDHENGQRHASSSSCAQDNNMDCTGYVLENERCTPVTINNCNSNPSERYTDVNFCETELNKILLEKLNEDENGFVDQSLDDEDNNNNQETNTQSAGTDSQTLPTQTTKQEDRYWQISSQTSPVSCEDTTRYDGPQICLKPDNQVLSGKCNQYAKGLRVKTGDKTYVCDVKEEISTSEDIENAIYDIFGPVIDRIPLDNPTHRFYVFAATMLGLAYMVLFRK